MILKEIYINTFILICKYLLIHICLNNIIIIYISIKKRVHTVCHRLENRVRKEMKRF